jgi:glycosyltransferase involved in cell wall biosynthesis
MGYRECGMTNSFLRKIWAETPEPLRPVLRWARRLPLQIVSQCVMNRWPDFSRLFLVSDSASWVISWEMREVAEIAQRIGVKVADIRWLPVVKNQSVFYGSQFSLLENDCLQRPWRVGVAYFHGRPGTGVPEFDQAYQRLCQIHPCIQRIQVSHTEMREIVLSTGVEPQRVFLIPIGIDLRYFSMRTRESRRKAREKFGIPQSAVVVGSFQKDGVGWGDGLEPKLIKGPDVFLKVVDLLKARIPELFVLLSGPARGYVKAGLERLGVPYRHVFLKHYPEIGQLFQALDVYLVTSRQEGGPKAVLESMASGIPLVTTRVGQAMDLVRHGENGWMVDVDDAEALSYCVDHVVHHCSSLDPVLSEGRETAEANSYSAQTPLWASFMKGFVEY